MSIMSRNNRLKKILRYEVQIIVHENIFKLYA